MIAPEAGAALLDSVLRASCMGATVYALERRRSPPPPLCGPACPYCALLEGHIGAHLRYVRMIAPVSFSQLAGYLEDSGNGFVLDYLDAYL